MLVLIASICIVSSCSSDKTSSQTQSQRTQTNAHTKAHEGLKVDIAKINKETAYSDIYSVYEKAVNHREEYKCGLDIDNLLLNMLYGRWEDSNGNYISYIFYYQNYDNTEGNTWYGTNLKTSKTFGNTYYYFTETKKEKLIIGYQDKLTDEKTENFIITFKENSILVESYVDNEFYEMNLCDNNKIVKGNAKMAYVYIGKKIFSFKAPNSVQITKCHVDAVEEIVYFTAQASNSFGGSIETEYKIYKIGDYYFIEEYANRYSTNVDLDELNRKLQEYVAKGE